MNAASHKILEKAVFVYFTPTHRIDTNKQFISRADFNSIRRELMVRKVSIHATHIRNEQRGVSTNLHAQNFPPAPLEAENCFLLGLTT